MSSLTSCGSSATWRRATTTTTTAAAAYDNTAALGKPNPTPDMPSTWASTSGTGWSAKQATRYC